MKTYSVTLKLIGEARVIADDGAAIDAFDVASIRKDFGEFAETIIRSSDLDLMTPCKSLVAGIDRSAPEFLIQMLHLARDMEHGAFRGHAFAEAVADGVLCGGSFHADCAPDVLRQFEDMRLTVAAPASGGSKMN